MEAYSLGYQEQELELLRKRLTLWREKVGSSGKSMSVNVEMVSEDGRDATVTARDHSSSILQRWA